MSARPNETRAMPGHCPGAFLKLTQALLLVVVAGGLLLCVPAFAQSTDAANTNTGVILGTVADSNSDPIPGAMVVLQGAAGERLTVTTNEDGSFALKDVPPGTAYQIAVTAEGYADWSSPVTIEPGQDKNLGEIKLRILAVEREITVSYSSKEVAAQQLKAEEHQRILGVIPNVYVTYEPHPEPLTTKMKFRLAYGSLTHPVSFGRVAVWAGVQQARDNPHEWGQGAEGFGKRLGAGYADAVTGSFITNAILPSLLHQDPRYFYRGTGTKWSRARHAMLAPFVCKGDNGAWQPNYSQWGGSVIGYSISTAYYPGSNRTAEHVFGTFGIDMGLHVISSLVQEFILGKFTTRGER